MPANEEVAFWMTAFSYVIAFCLLAWATVFKRSELRKAAEAFVGVGMACHTAVLILRWVNSGHIPVGSTYELNLIGTWLGMAMYVLLGRLMHTPSSAGLVVLPVIFLLLGMGITSKTSLGPLSPAYRSSWLVVHVIFAFLAFGCFLLASGAAATFLVRVRNFKGRLSAAGAAAVPVRALENTAYKLVAIGFIFHGVMLVSGTIWANDLWGSYWSWDPVETWSLVTFLIYALYLHLRTFYNWRGRRGAWSVLVAFATVLISYWGIQYVLPSVHRFGSF